MTAKRSDSLPAAAVIASAATEMDQHALHLDQQAAAHADKAAVIKRNARQQAEDLLRQAQAAADSRIAEEDKRAAPDEDTAATLRAQAEYWRGLARTQRKAAGLPEPEALPPGRPLGAQTPSPWTDPNGVTWDLSLTYQDPSGQRWHWSNGYFGCARHPGQWPLMSHDDFGVIDIPFCECPQLRPADEAEQTGQFEPVPPAALDQATATPAQQDGSRADG